MNFCFSSFFHAACSFLSELGTFFHFVSHTIFLTFTRKNSWKSLQEQLYEVGARSFPIIGGTGLATGLILSAQAFFILSEKGLTGITGIMVTKALLVELGPILTAFMITGRVGAAMCAELGTMKVTEQIDALRSMAVDPIHFLIVPRFLAGCLLFPLLTVCSSILGIIGGYCISVYSFHLSSADFLAPIPLHVSLFDCFSGLFKSVVFGFIIVTISCYCGLQTKGGASGVGKKTTQSVVSCYAVILTMDFFLTLFLHLYKHV